jgi:hypothetical protein
MKGIDYVCSKCGTRIVFDAWVEYNPETTEYEIVNIFDGYYCEECQVTHGITDKEIELEDERLLQGKENK